MGSNHENAAERSDMDDHKRVLDWIAQLMSPNTRENALLELSKKREQVPELALILWHSFGETKPFASLEGQKTNVLTRS